MAAKKLCNHQGCNTLIDKSSRYCEIHTKDTQSYDKQRGNANERGYTARWRRYRLSFLKIHPLCVECLKVGKVVSATVVDHICDHKGNYELFWDVKNHQVLCARCHNSKTLRTNPMR